TRYAKYDTLVANSVIARPATCCDSASGTVSTPWSTPKAAPVAAATRTPVHRPAPEYTASQPGSAPATMLPSIPRFGTLARSADHLEHPGEPRERAGQERDERERAPHRHARELRRARVGAGRAHGEAERRIAQQRCERRGERERIQESRVDARALDQLRELKL